MVRESLTLEKLIWFQLRCTQNSYRVSEVLRMERAIYRCIAFNCYGEEPMIFLQRFIFAAFREGDRMFKELCTFLVDTLVSNLITTCIFIAGS